MSSDQVREFFKLNLNNFKIARGFSQRQIADKLNIKQSLAGSYLAGESFPKAHILLMIADLLQVDVRKMLTERIAYRSSMPLHHQAQKAIPEIIKKESEHKYTMSSEMAALINLIDERKTGWAVDIAKQRIEKLAKVINQ